MATTVTFEHFFGNGGVVAAGLKHAAQTGVASIRFPDDLDSAQRQKEQVEQAVRVAAYANDVSASA